MKKILLLILMSILLSACGLQPIKVDPMGTYTLDQVSDNHIHAAKTNKILLVSMPTASPAFDGTGMVYVQVPHRVDYFTKNRWVDSPAHMIQPLIVQALQNSGRYRAVVATPYSGLADYRLDTQLLRLQQDFTSKRNHIGLIMTAQLMNLKTERVIATARFTIAENTPNATPQGGVIAANLAVAKLMQQLTAFCVSNG